MSCFAHGLQLVISQLFKEHVVIPGAFKKMAQIVNKFKHSHNLTKVAVMYLLRCTMIIFLGFIR